MPGAALSPYSRPLRQKPGQMGIDPHTGLPGASYEDVARGAREAASLKAAQYAMNQANAGGYAATSSYRDPSSGVSYNFSSPGGGRAGSSGSGSGSGDGELDDFDFTRALQQVQPALPVSPGPAVLPAHVQASSPADSAAAEASEFGRAKDRIGRLGRGSMTALNEEFSSRGFGGSNMEAGATQNLLSDLQGQEGEVIRDQTMQNLARRRQVEDRNYAGDLNQRGQDIGFTTTTRGQDISAAQGRSQMQVPLLQLIAANRRKRLY